MQRLSLRDQWGVLLLLAGCLLSGCFGVNPITPTQFYLLNPVDYDANPVIKTNPPLSVEIAALRLPQYLEKPQIITRSHRNRLKIAEYHRWGENLKKNMIRVIAQNMSQLLATPNVAMAPFLPLTPPDFSVEVEVMRFESDEHGQVHFSAQFRLYRGKDGKTITTRMADLKKTLPEGPPDYDQIIRVMDELLGDFCQIIAREMLNQSIRNPSPSDLP